MALEIVVYDSSPIIQKIFSHVLYPYGPKIHRVDQPEQLLTKVRQKKPDIIFIDPSTSEDNTSSSIKQDKELNHIPLVLMSNTALKEKNWSGLKSKAFLQKPIEAKKLNQIIRHFVPKTKTNIIGEYLQFTSFPPSSQKKKDIPRSDDQEFKGDLPEESPSAAKEGDKPSSEEDKGIALAAVTEQEVQNPVTSSEQDQSPALVQKGDTEEETSPIALAHRTEAKITHLTDPVETEHTAEKQEEGGGNSIPLFDKNNLKADTSITAQLKGLKGGTAVSSPAQILDKITDELQNPVTPSPQDLKPEQKNTGSLKTSLGSTHQAQSAPLKNTASSQKLFETSNNEEEDTQIASVAPDSINIETLKPDSKKEEKKSSVPIPFKDLMNEEHLSRELKKEVKAFFEAYGKDIATEVLKKEIKTIVFKMAQDMIQKQIDKLLDAEEDKN